MLEGIAHNSTDPDFWMTIDDIMYYVAYFASLAGLGISIYAWRKVRKIGYIIFALYFCAPVLVDTLSMLNNERKELELEQGWATWEEQMADRGIMVINSFRIPILELLLPIGVYLLWRKDSANKSAYEIAGTGGASDS